jgi:hypothetical protein
MTRFILAILAYMAVVFASSMAIGLFVGLTAQILFIIPVFIGSLFLGAWLGSRA